MPSTPTFRPHLVKQEARLRLAKLRSKMAAKDKTVVNRSEPVNLSLDLNDPNEFKDDSER